MLTVAYIANEFPSPVEPYVLDEIRQLRKRGVHVVPCSVHRPGRPLAESLTAISEETLYLRPILATRLFHAAGLFLCNFPALLELLVQLIKSGNQSFQRRLRALAHTWLGAYYALLLRDRGVGHIHVHHGYFASWAAMVAARLMGVSFSMTLHGSDLLVHRAFLQTKLVHCKFCVTVSEFNRQHILSRYPDVDPAKIIVRRMGVDVFAELWQIPESKREPSPLILLSVGRLHPVKDHAFLLRACRELKDQGAKFLCLIAGDGPERSALEALIHNLDLQMEVSLLGHLSRQALDGYYSICDLVVLTSRSEGIPLVLMEAMAHSRPVLAPAITGIPELVMDGKTGFLYQAGSIVDFVARIEEILNCPGNLSRVRRAARQHVLENFNREKNLEAFADCFLAHVDGDLAKDRYEDPVLQQI